MPGKSHGQRSLVGYEEGGRNWSDADTCRHFWMVLERPGVESQVQTLPAAFFIISPHPRQYSLLSFLMGTQALAAAALQVEGGLTRWAAASGVCTGRSSLLSSPPPGCTQSLWDGDGDLSRANRPSSPPGRPHVPPESHRHAVEIPGPTLRRTSVTACSGPALRTQSREGPRNGYPTLETFLDVPGMRSWSLEKWFFCRAPAERLLWPGRAPPSASQLLAFSPGKEQAAGVWETCLAPA